MGKWLTQLFNGHIYSTVSSMYVFEVDQESHRTSNIVVEFVSALRLLNFS
jgi:hypothetical protein